MLDRAARYYGDDLISGGEPGRFARVLRVVARNPGRTLAAALLVAGTAAIVVNAAFRQAADHPSPFFATRTAETAATGTPAAAQQATQSPAVPAPAANPERVDELARIVQTAMAETPQVTATPASPSVVEAQQLLTRLGYEPGTVDGLFGTRTRRAIEAFETARGLTVTGEVSEALLTQLRTAAAAPATATTPAPAAPVAAQVAGDPAAPSTILAVQTALNQSGYGPVVANGTVDAATTAAIRRFQLDNGLSVTGALDSGLIARMTAIGALTL
ncbi:MAG: peptidoglycan-binding protein [Bauldia sp.]|nr:peptidoglycan-binding protein [Bauldia sp.]